MKNKLFEKLKNVGIAKGQSLESSVVYKTKRTKTTMPILNIAWSGVPDGGMPSGVTVFAGESRTFKSNLALVCVKSYLDAHEDSYCVFYDSEYGSDESYFDFNQIDKSRVLHVPVNTLEELKFDMTAKLKTIETEGGGKYIFILDSLGALSSEKENKDIEDNKSVADMQRPKVIKTLMRSISGKLKKNDLPFIMINHTYQTMDIYSKNVQGGGASVTYFPSDVFFLSRSQEKEGDKLAGYKFTITIEKSRTIRDKTKFAFSVSSKHGIIKHSGIFELALESGDILELKKGYYNFSKEGTEEPLDEKSYRRKALDTAENIDIIIKRQSFINYLKNNLLLINSGVEEQEYYDEDIED